MAGDMNGHVTRVGGKGATRHCCYSVCNSDSRYAHKENMNGITWVVFPKPHKDLDKCKRWVRACGRANFSVERVNKWTYISSKHFVGGAGPTAENPDPIPATFTPVQVGKLSGKRKPTPQGFSPVSKKILLEVSEALVSLQDIVPEPSPLFDGDEQSNTTQVSDDDGRTVSCEISTQTEKLQTSTHMTQETQTTYVCSMTLANRIVDKSNKSNAEGHESCEVLPDNFSFENISKDEKLFYFYTGLTVSKFRHLFSSLGDETKSLIYWRGKRTSASGKVLEKKLSAESQLLLTLIKLRHAFPNKDLAHRFGISSSTVSVTVNTWIQYLYKKTYGLRRLLFPTREIIKDHLPSCFHSFKNVRVIIDCFEIYSQSSTDFAEQGNMYSSYKHRTTLKCLVGISPTGGISFLSDTYEGSISDKEIFVKSGLANLLDPGDLVIADRGFLIREILQACKVDLNIPPFLGQRDKLTPQEEILTKRIARVRIHVERAIERMKKYKIIGKILPLSLKPVVSQIVHVIGFLVNYQAPLVK